MTHGGGERDGLNEEGEEAARERQRNEMAFTFARFSNLGRNLIPDEEDVQRERERARQYALSEEARVIARRNEIDPNMMAGRLVYYDAIEEERPSEWSGCST